jgi:hypothetical protein
MKLVFADFITEKRLVHAAGDAVPPDNSYVTLPDDPDGSFRRVMSSEWRVVQQFNAPQGYHEVVVWVYLSELKGVPEPADDVEARMVEAWRDTGKIDNGEG